MSKIPVLSVLAALFLGAFFVSSIVMFCKNSLFGFFPMDIAVVIVWGCMFLGAILIIEPLEAAMERKHPVAFKRMHTTILSILFASGGIFLLLLVLPFLGMAYAIVLNILGFLLNMNG